MRTEPAFPFIEVWGDPYELGYRHGSQAADQIHAFLEYLYRKAGREPAAVLRAAAHFEPLFRRHTPALLPEIEGLADGAEIRKEEALLLQLRSEVLPLSGDPGCTSFAVAAGRTVAGRSLLGQTSDVDPPMLDFFLVIRVRPVEGPDLLMWTLAGQLGYHGVSSAGTAHFANNLGGGPTRHRTAGGQPAGLSHYPVKRLMFDCRSREEVEALWRSIPVVSSGNYMVAAGDELFDLEVTPDGFAAANRPGEGLLVHANHFVAPEFRTAATDAAALPDSHHRQSRLEELLQARAGSIDVPALQEMLADHHNHPRGICRHESEAPPGHPEPIQTAAALICEPASGTLHVSHGQPCRRHWTSYHL